jgi:hypothetical protein
MFQKPQASFGATGTIFSADGKQLAFLGRTEKGLVYLAEFNSAGSLQSAVLVEPNTPVERVVETILMLMPRLIRTSEDLSLARNGGDGSESGARR